MLAHLPCLALPNLIVIVEIAEPSLPNSCAKILIGIFYNVHTFFTAYIYAGAIIK